jgi:hypothetical protein
MIFESVVHETAGGFRCAHRPLALVLQITELELVEYLEKRLDHSGLSPFFCD